MDQLNVLLAKGLTVAAAVVVATYLKTRSMLWCCIFGVAAYVLLTLL